MSATPSDSAPILPSSTRPLVVFSDLDGTLLDGTTYAFDAATEALALLRAREVPLVLASSKTRAEIEPIRFRLEHRHPFIVENGGAVFIPKGYFPFPVDGATLRGEYQVIEWGAPYARLRGVLKEVEHIVGCPLRGFGDMAAEEIAQRTGLSPADAHLAKQREYDEPFVIDASEDAARLVLAEVEARGLRVTRGGRFFHLLGDCDKGRACRLLLEAYRQRLGDRLQSVALGDSLNDLPMLAAVERPILVQKPDGAFDPEVRLPGLTRAPGIGPAGWNRAVLDLLGTSGA